MNRKSSTLSCSSAKKNPGAALSVCVSPVWMTAFTVMCLIDSDAIIPVSLLSSLFHETAHLAAGFLSGCPRADYSFRIPAMAIENDRLWMPDCKTEAAVSAAGPTANLFLCALLAALRLKTASTINFALFLINALPVMTLDGGNILFCVASDRFGPVFAERICKAVSFAVIIPIIAAGAIIFETTGKNFSLLAVGLFLLFSLFPKRRA